MRVPHHVRESAVSNKICPKTLAFEGKRALLGSLAICRAEKGYSLGHVADGRKIEFKIASHVCEFGFSHQRKSPSSMDSYMSSSGKKTKACDRIKRHKRPDSPALDRNATQ